MKRTGIIRKSDELGRIVIPIDLRNKFGIEKKSYIEIFVKRNNIILRKIEHKGDTNGIVRQVDELGRVVIPKEIRDIFGISEGDPLEVLLDASDIVLKKFEASCTFCGSRINLYDYEEKLICKKCVKKIKAIEV